MFPLGGGEKGSLFFLRKKRGIRERLD